MLNWTREGLGWYIVFHAIHQYIEKLKVPSEVIYYGTADLHASATRPVIIKILVTQPKQITYLIRPRIDNENRKQTQLAVHAAGCYEALHLQP